MTAVFAMLISVFLFSLYPLLASFGLGKNDPVLFVMLAHFFCSVASFAIGYRLFKNRYANERKFCDSLKIEKHIWLSAFATGAAAAVAHSCFMLALIKTSQIGATIIYETWPILAIWLTPFLVAKAWEKVRSLDYIFGFLALIGVGFIVSAESREVVLQLALSAFQDIEPTRLEGYVLAFIGSLGIALSTVLRARVSQYFTGRHDGDVMLSACFSSGLTRFAALPFFVLCFWYFYEDGISGMVINDVWLTAAIGVIVYTGGSLFYTYGFLGAKNPNIQVLYYLAPVLSITWLQIFGFSHINDFVVIGTLFVLTANLLVTIKAEHSFSYTSSMLTLLFGGAYCYFTTGRGLPDFYDAISFTTVIYAILIAFAWDRVISRSKHVETLALDISYRLDDLRASYKKKDKKPLNTLTKYTAELLSTGDKQAIHLVYKKLTTLKKSWHDETIRVLYKDIDSLVLSKLRDMMLSEIVLLALIGGSTIFGLMVFRPDGLWQDTASVVMSAAVVFIFFAIFDQMRECGKNPMRNGNATCSEISPDLFRPKNEFNFIAIVLISMLLLVFAGLFSYKHGAFPFAAAVI
ncbi:MAG: DMT family transporter [Alphaproteobacteria bacterium]|nr:MAG: DMT family transporter [Alphaproteobacteria bacterium]